MANAKNETNAQTLLSEETPKTQDAGRQSVDLSAPGVAKAVSKRILEDIDAWVVKTYDGGHRWHLGASLIGEECKRKLWYMFRWCFREQTDGRKQRLFNRGHREEARFVEWLEGIGVQVWFENRDGFYYIAESDSYGLAKDLKEGSIEENLAWFIPKDHKDYLKHVARAKADGLEFPQFRVSSLGGHFGGSLDGIAILPERYGIKEPVLLEFKTNGTGAGFNKLVENGMPVAKPQHFGQTSVYGSDPQYNFRYVLYLNINKNDDSLHVEVVKLDAKLGDNLRMKAEQIIMSQTPPPRISDNPTFLACSWCGAKDVCHKGAIPEKNCRSCKFARPVDGGEWHCDMHNGVIPRDYVKQGCPSYIPITALSQNV